MAAKDLITLARAYFNLPGISDDPVVSALITAASDAIIKYCRRDFNSKSYDELYNGNGDRRLLLRQYPIQSITSVRYRPVTVLKIINNDTLTNQQARVQVTSTGLTISTVASGVPASTNLDFASNVTITAMATAINALGNGWAAQIVGDDGTGGGAGDYGLWPSADLYVPPSFGDGTTSQGNLTARGQNAELKMHTYEMAGYQFDPRGWLLRAIPYTDPELLHPEDLVWPVGINNLRVQYTAGYTTVPEGVQEASAEWVSILYRLTLRDPSAANTFGGSTGNAYMAPSALRPPPTVQAILAPYRRRTISSEGG